MSTAIVCRRCAAEHALESRSVAAMAVTVCPAEVLATRIDSDLVTGSGSLAR